MQIAFQISDRALPRRVVAERDVDVGVDEAGHRSHAGGIDHDIGALDCRSRSRPHGCDPLAVDEDRITAHKGIMPIAGDDLAEVDDRDLH